MDNEAKETVETISELVESQAVFQSNGFAEIKVTRNGKQKTIRLPIKTIGAAEASELQNKRVPRPPVINKLVSKNCGLGKELGLTKDAAMMVYDTTDESYINAREKYDEDIIWQAAAVAIDISWVQADGTIAETYEDKRRVLESSGITSAHIMYISQAVTSLTNWVETETDFLSEGS